MQQEPVAIRELAEGLLEQFRALWMGARIKVILEQIMNLGGVDTPEDVIRIEKILGNSTRK